MKNFVVLLFYLLGTFCISIAMGSLFPDEIGFMCFGGFLIIGSMFVHSRY